jgi:SH3-like domain-containing protein/tetratricopeptide (TPR) repeat protein
VKDPLQQEQTPYEVLGVDQSVGDAEIEKAFQAGLGRRGNVQKLTASRLALKRPIDRTLLNIFHYDPKALQGLTPNPLSDPSLLQVPRRAQTAFSWEQILQKSFPDLGVVHSLGVLWYWWAISGDGAASPDPHGKSGGAEGSATLPRSAEIWERVIACWAMLVATREFWSDHLQIPRELQSQVQSAIVDRLRNKFHEVTERDTHDSEKTIAHQKLDLAMTTELSAAEAMAAAGILVHRRKLSCGPLMLAQVGLSDTLQRQVAAALTQNSSVPLKKLRDALSPYSSIRALLGQKPQAAIEAINALSDTEQRSDEVFELKARALFELGRQQASLSQFVEALESWRLALQHLPRHPDLGGLPEEINEQIVTTCLTRANTLAGQQRPSAIEILEKGLAINSDEKLKVRLRDLLTQQGIETITDAYNRAQHEKIGSADELLAAADQALTDLDRAAALGSSHAAQQREIVKGILDQWKSGLLDLPAEVRALRQKATDGANRKDWDTFIRRINDAIDTFDAQVPEILLKELAVGLAHRAFEQTTNAIQMLSQEGERRQALLDSLRYHISQTGTCHGCGKWQHTASGEMWYSVNLPQGGTVMLCAACVTHYEINKGPDPAAIDRLRSAESDLLEAVELDSTTEQMKTNLREVQDLLVRLGKQPATKSRSRRARKLRRRQPVAGTESQREAGVPLFDSARGASTGRFGRLAARLLLPLALVALAVALNFDIPARPAPPATSEAPVESRPTATATSSEAAAAVNVKYRVRVRGGAELREGPGTEFPLVGQNGATAQYEVSQETPGWRRIGLSGGRSAWVSKSETSRLKSEDPKSRQSERIKTDECRDYVILPNGAMAVRCSPEVETASDAAGQDPEAPTREVGREFVTPSESGLGLRRGPGKEFEVIRTTLTGERYQIVSSYAEWYRVRLPEGTEAWISAFFVKKVQ